MKPNEPSRTALIIARQRAAHQVLDHGSILYDPFAMKILREDEKDVLQFANAHPLASIGRLFTAARSRIAEDALSRAVERGVRQIVILGAGLDTFALRNPHGARQIRIYEVDHPATQAWKGQRLAEAQIALPPWLIFVPVDFERDDVGEKLVAAGFQQNSSAFFTWLGVVPYLTQDAIGRTLDYMSSIQNSEVVFDYMEPPEAFSEELRQLEKARTEQLKKMDERSVSRFEPAGIAAILRSHGFCAIEDISFQEIASRFGRAVQGLAPGHAGVHVVHAKQYGTMDGAKTAGKGNNQVLEAKLIVGRFIDFTRPNWPGGAPPAAQIPALFATQPQQLLNIAESTGVFTKTSSVTAGAHANVNKPWRTFNFLSWLPGSISEVQTGTHDVLTGPMSGCDLVLYNRLGNRCAGHLGTDVSVTPGDTKDLANLSIKAVWNNFAQNAPAADIIGGFNPFRQWNGAFPVGTGNDLGGPIFYGLYTSANTFYAMVLFIQRSAPGSTSAHPTLKRIAGLQLITSKTLAQLRNL